MAPIFLELFEKELLRVVILGKRAGGAGDPHGSLDPACRDMSNRVKPISVRWSRYAGLDPRGRSDTLPPDSSQQEPHTTGRAAQRNSGRARQTRADEKYSHNSGLRSCHSTVKSPSTSNP